VSPVDRPEDQDENHQGRTRGHGIGQERQGRVPTGERLSHDPGADDHGEEQRGAERLGDEFAHHD
jgi:hypothetical protein